MLKVIVNKIYYYYYYYYYYLKIQADDKPFVEIQRLHICPDMIHLNSVQLTRNK